MSETTECPLGGLEEDGGCDGQAYLLFNGSLYCPKCEDGFDTEYTLTDHDLAEYDERVRDLIEADLDTAYMELVRLADVYYKEPLGFPTESEYHRFQTVFPLLFMKYIEELNTEMEDVVKQIDRELRKAHRR